MMELWPFTNFHDLNLDWIVKTILDWVKKMQNFITDITSEWNDMQQDWDDFKDHVYKDEIEEILAAHPEWTTTVQNGAITFQKLNGSIQAFTTPEAFGAVGDGVTDDTQAWQDAVDVGVKVIALSDTYKCGTINVTKDIEIDCNNAEFTGTADTIFDCEGELITTLMGENNYTGNATYNLISAGYTDYTGFAFIRGDNNWNPCRDYYLAGFTAFFKNGTLVNDCPVNVSNPRIEIVEPITCTIKNIGGLEHSTYSSNTKSIHIKYGVNCVIENVRGLETSGYEVIALEKCHNCRCADYAITHLYGTTGTNSYIVALLDSSYCTLETMNLYNKNWHCITTGGNYICMNNTIRDVYAESDGIAISDHENAIGTRVYNTTSSGLSLAQECVAENVTLTSADDTAKRCFFYLQGSPIKNLANYYIRNITFAPDPAISETAAVYLRTTPTQNVSMIYYDNVMMENVINTTDLTGNYSAIGCYGTITNITTIQIGSIVVDNTNMQINFYDVSAVYDFSNAVITVKNIKNKTKHPTPRYPQIIPATGSTLIVSDSIISNIATTKTPADVRLSNVKFEYTTGITLQCTGWLQATNVWSGYALTLSGCEKILASNIVTNGNRLYEHMWRINSSSNIFALRLTNQNTPTEEVYFTI